MNKKICHILSALLLLFVAGACNEAPFGPENGQTPDTGLSLRKLMVQVEHDELLRSTPGDFFIRIMDGSEVVRAGWMTELPEIIDLPVGNFTVVASNYEQVPAAEWEAPYYEGKTDIEIRSGEIAEPKEVVCKFSNIKVTVVFDPKLQAVMGDDCRVSVKVGDGAQLEFTKDETRRAFFAYVKGSNTLVASFKGTVDGAAEENSRPYVDVKPGTHYRITYTLHGSDVDVPEPEGKVFPGLVVDATVHEETINFDVDLDDDHLTDDGRPTQGDDPVKPDDPVTPSDSAPEFTAKGEASFDVPVTITASSNIAFDVKSTAAGGFKTFTVQIDSETLTPDELSLVGLASNLDLVNPGEFAGPLQTLGFPINVGGLSNASFDLSQFMQMLAILEGTHKFIITVSDANGTTVKTLTLVVK